MKKINKFLKQQSASWRINTKQRISRSGYSLIEVLIALFVLSIGLVVISALMIRNIKNSENIRDQIIASELSQEGSELVRNLNDEGKLNVAPYITTATSLNDLRVDINSTYETLDDTGTSKQLNLSSGYFYVHSAGTATKFFRRIDLSIQGVYNSNLFKSTRMMTVTSYVTWNDKGFISDVSLDTAGLSAGNCNMENKCVSVISTIHDIVY